MAADYYPAPALLVLLDEANKEHPGRDKSSDGWVGDTSHKASGRPENGGSKHNPNARGAVDARDFDNSALDKARFVAAAIQHPSTRNIIYDRKIRSKGYPGGLSRVYAYHGPNPHDKHIHVDIEMTVGQENDRRAWGYYRGVKTVPVIAVPVSGKPGKKTPKGGMTRMPVLRRNPAYTLSATRTLQRALVRLGFGVGDAGVDGRFGTATFAAVRKFQRAHHLVVDGIVGPKTWVAVVQALVAKAGQNLAIDGDFGPKTAAAVVAFQNNRKLKADGIVGPITFAALLK